MRESRGWAPKAVSRLNATLRCAGLSTLILVTVAAIPLTLSVSIWGVVMNARSVAIIGLAGTAVVTMTMAAIGWSSIRALAESEHARVELRIANERLRQQNTELQARELAVEEGLE